MRPKIFKDLELKEHGLKVYLRNPSSYTPLRHELWKDGGPSSLILGMSDEENKKQISQFSKKDAEKFGEYETQLQRFVDAIDHLLDHSPLKIHPVSSPFGLVMRLNIEIKLGMIYFIYLSSINLCYIGTYIINCTIAIH